MPRPATSEDQAKVFDLDVERATRFLDQLAEHPFACVVLTGDGELKIVSKDMPEDELDRFMEALTVLEDQGDDA